MALVFLISGTAFANNIDATDVFLSILPSGEYYGVTEKKNEQCSVTVRKLANRVAVVAKDPNRTIIYEVYVGTGYYSQVGKRFFLSSTITTTLTSTIENFVRTTAVTANTQYVAVGEILRSEDRHSNKNIAVECIIDL